MTKETYTSPKKQYTGIYQGFSNKNPTKIRNEIREGMYLRSNGRLVMLRMERMVTNRIQGCYNRKKEYVATLYEVYHETQALNIVSNVRYTFQ